MSEKFYITTPIYYINGEPHIGHAYTSIAVDIIARFKRMDGCTVYFCTGTDEHGIKVARSAEKAGIDINTYADIASEKFRNMGRKLDLSNDDFIRTTEARHIKSAQEFWKRLSHDIYKDKYVGWYDPRDETFVAESDIVNGIAPSGGKVEWMEEEAYFFKLSAYQDQLLDYYAAHPDFIAPASRRNEVINFVKDGLKDLCISRSKFAWGIPVPGDDKHVMYVWIDALANYITSFGFPNHDVKDQIAHCTHIVGKEILRFHAVYWPAFLMSAGIGVPHRIFAHGWWTSEGQKMSKSVGNVVDPMKMIDDYGLDQLRYFLFREVKFGDDGDFSQEAFKNRIKYDLANDFGNLVQRILAFIYKNGAKLSVDYNFDDAESIFYQHIKELIPNIRQHMNVQDLHATLLTIWNLIGEANTFVSDKKPWELAKVNSSKLNSVLTVLIEAIRTIAFGVAAFMPHSANKIFNALHMDGKLFSELNNQLSDFELDHQPEPLFPQEK